MTEQQLQQQMKALLAKQQSCLWIQKILLVLSILFYPFAILLLPAHVVWIILRGSSLSNQALSLAREKYPYVPMAVTLGGKVEWEACIIPEARRLQDDLTVRLLKFNRYTLYYGAAALLGNGLMWLAVPAVFSLG